MKISGDLITSSNKNIPYTFYKQDEKSNCLAIILPGTGYTTESPLLRYTTQILIKKDIDVLHVNYRYSQEELSALNEVDFTNDILSVIESIISEYKYEHFKIIAKSIGTIAMTYLLDNPKFQSAEAYWLTPLLQRDDVYLALKNADQKGLCIIGDCDQWYNEERFEVLKGNNILNLNLIEGANHSLEIENNIFDSIDLLKKIMNIIHKF
ncbi:alpha/beta family hydrolase [Gottfriedia sp. OAE603]|uniref:alpha/beta family hydrolase n=1 Tax=Gottfriedia sp. OAE603 TaxID=2663872 RepID=UPI00178A8A78